MARYLFINKQTAIDNGLIEADTVRMISKDGKTVVLIEDDIQSLGSDMEAIATDLQADILEQKQALKRIEKEF